MRKYNKLFEVAHMRDEHGNLYSGEPLLIAVLMKTRAKSRAGEQEAVVHRIMRDINLD